MICQWTLLDNFWSEKQEWLLWFREGELTRAIWPSWKPHTRSVQLTNRALTLLWGWFYNDNHIRICISILCWYLNNVRKISVFIKWSLIIPRLPIWSPTGVERSALYETEPQKINSSSSVLSSQVVIILRGEGKTMTSKKTHPSLQLLIHVLLISKR